MVLLIGCNRANNTNFGSRSYESGQETADLLYGASSESPMLVYNYYYTLQQIDSMCISDNLPRNLEDWITEKFYNIGTGKYLVKRMYIKLYEDDSEIIYLIVPKDSLYKVTKRFVNCDPNQNQVENEPVTNNPSGDNKNVKKNPPKDKLIKDIFIKNKFETKK